LAIAGVEQRADSLVVKIEKRGMLPIPIQLTLYSEQGEKHEYRQPMDI